MDASPDQNSDQVKITDSELAGRVMEYSKELYELVQQDEPTYDSLPYFRAYELMVGTSETPPLWERIASDNPLTEDERDIATTVVNQYPKPRNLPEFKEKQQNFASFFDTEIRFDKYDVRFAKDLINKINDGRLLSEEQFKRVKYFIYRYREQLRDQIIYEGNGSDRLYEFLGDDKRAEFDSVIEECKEAHDEVNNRYE